MYGVGSLHRAGAAGRCYPVMLQRRRRTRLRARTQRCADAIAPSAPNGMGSFGTVDGST